VGGDAMGGQVGHHPSAELPISLLYLQQMRFAAALLVAVSLAGCASQPSVPPAVNAVALYTPPPPLPPPPYDEISIKSTDRRIPVIMYHDVIAKRTARSQWFDCSRDEFEAQLAFFQERGINPISIGDLYEHLTLGKEVPESSVVLTFDDNYQGFYDNALPLLRKYGYPSAMFVHTGFIGDKKGDHPKMDWKELKELHKEGLVTIGSHTISHPDDLSKLPFEVQEKELKESKELLEEKLGGPIEFLAYPNGKYDKTTADLARILGYKMSFTIANGLAEESPGILEVNRYVHTRMEKAWEDRDKAIKNGVTYRYEAPITVGPITYESEKVEGCDLRLIRGGMPTTFISDARQGVSDLVKATGSQAGINGTFFAMAAIKSTDNRLVGPSKTPEMAEVLPDMETTRWPKLRNRPLVMWGPYGAAIYPYQPATMVQDRAYREGMLDMTDCFLGGAWLVHQGMARTREQILATGSSDSMDYRRRAFFGFDMDGRPICGATYNSVTSEQFAVSLAEKGVSEAVLLDSGFSTSLVLGEKILASGHSSPDNPSRPIPHAILLKGEVDKASEELAKKDEIKAGEVVAEDAPPKRRRRRRRN
ncbi:hypothetical protein EON81_02540, partial [bacterium]